MSTLLDIPVIRLCWCKLEGILIRMFYVVRMLPVRIWRILTHFRTLFVGIYRDPNSLLDFSENLFWLIELICYVADLFGIPELYETIADIVKINTRPLTREEEEAIKSHFGNSLQLRRIRIDTFAFGGPRTHHFAYVSFYTINSWGPLSPDTFIHEVMHVWQYEKMGSVYIPRALRAQYSSEGYDYGGLESLEQAIHSGQGLQQFNLEQQGDIMADYFRLKQGKNPRWSNITTDDIWIFEQLLKEISVKKEAA